MRNLPPALHIATSKGPFVIKTAAGYWSLWPGWALVIWGEAPSAPVRIPQVWSSSQAVRSSLNCRGPTFSFSGRVLEYLLCFMNIAMPDYYACQSLEICCIHFFPFGKVTCMFRRIYNRPMRSTEFISFLEVLFLFMSSYNLGVS